MKRFIAILLALCLCFMVACQGNNNQNVENENENNKASDDNKQNVKENEKDNNKENEAKNNEENSSSNDEEKSETLDLTEKYELVSFQWGPRDIAEGDEVLKAINEKFNVDWDVQRILAKEYAQNLEIKIAANDMPDFFRMMDNKPHIYNNLYEDGFLASFSEYAERFDLKSMKAWFGETGVDQYSEEGEFYRLPTRGGIKGSYTQLIVRQDWMDELGLDMPVTYEDFKDMLVAFRDSDLGGNSTIGLTGAGTNFTDFLGGFTGSFDWKKVDGNYVDVRVTDSYKDGLYYLNDLYEEELIDREIFTLNETQARQKYVMGTAGVVIPVGGIQDRFTQYETLLLENIPDANQGMIYPYPKGKEGNVQNGSTGLVNSMAVTKKGRDDTFIARIMGVLDYIHSEEGIKNVVYGIEGVHYNMADGKREYTEAGERDIITGIGHLTAMLTDYSIGKLNIHPLIDEVHDKCTEYAIYSDVPRTFSNETVDEYNVMVQEVFDEWSVGFITGSKDLDSEWDAYLKAMNRAGLDKITEVMDEYLKGKE